MLKDSCRAEFALPLADGTNLTLRAVDAESVRIASFVARAARLAAIPAQFAPGAGQVLVVTKSKQTGSLPHGSVAGGNGESVCVLGPRHLPLPLQWLPDGADANPGRGRSTAPILRSLTDEQWFWQQLVRLSAFIGRETHARGGVLLHSGLVAYPEARSRSSTGRAWVESGILLAGRSGVGKSTAIRRLPPPWRTLADDVTLLVRDESGTFWAHPWPTWSRFFGKSVGDGCDIWDVQKAVPLQAIFILEQGNVDRAEPIGPGQAVCLLAELGLQTSTLALRDMPLDEVAAFNLQRFNNLCGLLQSVPAYTLDIRLDGPFWLEIERVMR